MSTVTWQSKLDASTEEREIIAVVREFLAQFTPDEIRQLPVGCRPGKLFDANDVTTFAFELVRQDFWNEPEVTVLVHKLASFFAAASIRLSQILAHAQARDRDSRQSAS